MTTPEAGRVEDAALIMQRARGDQATIEAAQRLSDALTTQAETIRRLEGEVAHLQVELNRRP